MSLVLSAILGAAQLGLGIYGAVKSGQEKPTEPGKINMPDYYNEAEKKISQERQRMAEVEAIERNELRNLRDQELNMVSNIYQDPQSRFLASVGVNRTAVNRQTQLTGQQLKERRNMLGMDLSIAEGKANLFRTVKGLELERYNILQNQYNREQEAWGAAVGAGIDTLANAAMYNSIMKSSDTPTTTPGTGESTKAPGYVFKPTASEGTVGMAAKNAAIDASIYHDINTFDPKLEKEMGRIEEILQKNQDKNFVDRVLRPEKYPSMKLNKRETGTHLMSYAEVDGKYIVYPEIVYNTTQRKLTRLKGQDAIDYALENREYISFDNEKDAAWFSKNYKKFWGQESTKVPDKLTSGQDTITKKQKRNFYKQVKEGLKDTKTEEAPKLPEVTEEQSAAFNPQGNIVRDNVVFKNGFYQVQVTEKLFYKISRDENYRNSYGVEQWIPAGDRYWIMFKDEKFANNFLNKHK